MSFMFALVLPVPKLYRDDREAGSERFYMHSGCTSKLRNSEPGKPSFL